MVFLSLFLTTLLAEVDLHIVDNSCSSTNNSYKYCQTALTVGQIAELFRKDNNLVHFLQSFPEIKMVQLLSEDYNYNPKTPEESKRVIYLLVDFVNDDILKRSLFVANEEYVDCSSFDKNKSTRTYCGSSTYSLDIKGPVKIYDNNTVEDRRLASLVLNSVGLKITSTQLVTSTSYNYIPDRIERGGYSHYNPGSSIGGSKSYFNVSFTIPSDNVRFDVMNLLMKRGLIDSIVGSNVIYTAFSNSTDIAIGNK